MSHFTFTRNLYDKCALDKKDQESTSPFDYQTDKSVMESKETCFLGSSPFQHNPFKSIPTEHIDIENDLRGQTRKLSKCLKTRFDPTTAKQYTSKVNECVDEKLVPEYTRINKPCNIFSGISINRFHPLCDDMQTNIQSNTYIGSNTRLQIKDAYKNK